MTESQLALAISELAKKVDDLQGSVVGRLDALIMLAEKCLGGKDDEK